MSSKPFLISIVDDNQYARQALESLIRSLGYATASFQSADDFLSSGCVENTACLVTDIEMPGESGLDLHQQLQARGHQTPVIFVTGMPEEYRERCLRAGAIGFLNKPLRGESVPRSCPCRRSAGLAS